AKSATMIKHSDGFVIGGLTQEVLIGAKTKVPLLGDIRFLGQAFCAGRSAHAKTELYIIATPQIVRRVPTVATAAVRPR
ncbi:MAG: type II secretion system protein GspD, partial [Pseudomonadota bacterium]|nr:type II secretion system protein GspD [Pseudomonadota bacterium]